MNPRKMLTTAPREKPWRTVAGDARVKATSIALPNPSAPAVRRRAVARLDLIVGCLCMSKNLFARLCTHWSERQPTSVRRELVIRSKPCLLNSNSACGSVGCDYVACGTSANQFLLAATAQNIKWLVRFLAQRPHHSKLRLHEHRMGRNNDRETKQTTRKSTGNPARLPARSPPPCAFFKHPLPFSGDPSMNGLS